jgi:hypothetical protein
MAFFEKHLFENAIFLGFLRVSVCQMSFTKRPGVIFGIECAHFRFMKNLSLKKLNF